MECSACDLTPGQLQLSWHPDVCQPGLTCLTGPERDPCVVRPQARLGVWQRRLVPGEGAQLPQGCRGTGMEGGGQWGLPAQSSILLGRKHSLPPFFFPLQPWALPGRVGRGGILGPESE